MITQKLLPIGYVIFLSHYRDSIFVEVISDFPLTFKNILENQHFAVQITSIIYLS